MNDPSPPVTIKRHRLATRVWHWVTVVAMFIMIGSGIGILKAHPRLYWGRYGANFDTAWTTLDQWPSWLVTLLNLLTIPASYNLAISRRWHLLFALVLSFALLGFMIVSLVNRHFQRDLRVRAAELSPREVAGGPAAPVPPRVAAHDVKEHLAFRFHDPKRPGAYNILQKLSYVATIFVLIPVMILTGLAMSPNMDAAWPWLLEVFGGRQSARSIHFIAATGLVLFIVVHMALVILAGTWNEVRSMITGRWAVPAHAEEDVA
jgi:thiosulfate reductase cytochrome b subunit